MSTIFRQISLERLTSPEELDKTIEVTSLKSWLALIGAIIIIAVTIIWLITGSITIKTYGEGMLISGGGVYNVSHAYSGELTDVKIEAGDYVNKGDVIARIDRYKIVNEILMLQKQLKASEKLSNDESSINIESLKSEIELLQEQLKVESNVRTQVEGRVLEIKVNRGDLLLSGQSIASINNEDKSKTKLEVVMYIPAEEGKRIITGMDAHISPTIVNKEEYGYLVGKVVRVSSYASSQEGMLKTLGNKELVNRLAGDTAPIEIVIELIPSSDTQSGYRWSTKAGPPIEINNGTICTVEIIVHKKKPISFILPMIEGKD